MGKHALDLGEDTVGIYVPFFSTGRKIGSWIYEYSRKRFHFVREVSEYLEDKLAPSKEDKKRISLLPKINRVARIRTVYNS